MGKKRIQTLSGHHILPKSRYQYLHGLGVNTRRENIVWIPKDFHTNYHRLFSNMILSEVQEFLSILHKSKKTWTVEEVHFLREMIIRGKVRDLPRENKYVEDVRIDGWIFEKEEHRRAHDQMFGQMDIEEIVVFLQIIMKAHDVWKPRQLKALRQRLRQKVFYQAVLQISPKDLDQRCIQKLWHRFGQKVHHLQFGLTVLF